jgi:hypothetical protein
MMGVSLQLKKLYERFDGMVTGKMPMTTYEAAEFKRELRAVMARVGLMELGIANDTFDAALRAELPPSNVSPAEPWTACAGPNVVSLARARIDRIVARIAARHDGDAS